ncbi:MAG: hypothetical protein HQL53_08500 [Magnetococcales bacterium]|nr:hypothetical protein [Magnetococcales bacterium]
MADGDIIKKAARESEAVEANKPITARQDLDDMTVLQNVATADLYTEENRVDDSREGLGEDVGVAGNIQMGSRAERLDGRLEGRDRGLGEAQKLANLKALEAGTSEVERLTFDDMTVLLGVERADLSAEQSEVQPQSQRPVEDLQGVGSIQTGSRLRSEIPAAGGVQKQSGAIEPAGKMEQKRLEPSVTGDDERGVQQANQIASTEHDGVEKTSTSTFFEAVEMESEPLPQEVVAHQPRGIDLNLRFDLESDDGSIALDGDILITDLPPGAQLTLGEVVEEGTWRIPQAALQLTDTNEQGDPIGWEASGLALIPEDDSQRAFNLGITVPIRDGEERYASSSDMEIQLEALPEEAFGRPFDY